MYVCIYIYIYAFVVGFAFWVVWPPLHGSALLFPDMSCIYIMCMYLYTIL